jgi:hypothetical protein
VPQDAIKVKVFRFVFSRIVLCFLGFGAVSWSLSAFGPLSSASSLDQVSQRILQTEPFQLPLLRAVAKEADAASLDQRDRPETLREIAIVNERLLEQDIFEARRTAIDPQLEVTRKAIERALSAAPSDSFLWLMLYWVRTARAGFSESNLPLLRMSYLTGPNEGWVAIRRNRFTFIAAPFLPPDLLDRSQTEFVTMLASGFVDETADVFVGPAWTQRDLLLVRIENLPVNVKQRFARRVYDLGYDVSVPGIARFGDRPWR